MDDGDGDGDERNLGPDERDRDLLDGSWERQHYAGRARRRDWNAIGVGVAIIVLASFLVPVILQVTG